MTKYPRAGGAALYAKEAFRSPLVAFLVAFAVMASGVTSASALARAFGGDYLAEFVAVPVAVAALAFIAGGRHGQFHRNPGLGSAQRRADARRAGRPRPGGNRSESPRSPAAKGDPGRAVEFKEGTAPALAILAGAALAFYALIGFEDSVNIAEETTRPERSYPVALFAGLAAAGAIYLVVTIVASMAVPTQRLETSSGALLEVVQVGPLAVPTKVFSAIGLMAIGKRRVDRH